MLCFPVRDHHNRNRYLEGRCFCNKNLTLCGIGFETGYWTGTWKASWKQLINSKKTVGKLLLQALIKWTWVKCWIISKTAAFINVEDRTSSDWTSGWLHNFQTEFWKYQLASFHCLELNSKGVWWAQEGSIHFLKHNLEEIWRSQDFLGSKTNYLSRSLSWQKSLKVRNVLKTILNPRPCR